MDSHPTSDINSSINTSPPSNTSTVYRKRPKQYGQLGRATAYTSIGNEFTSVVKPHYYEIAAWDQARKEEPIIYDGISKIALSVKAKVGSYVHPNKDIMKFINSNIKGLIEQWFYQATLDLLTFGTSVGEAIWQRKIGPDGIPQVWVEDIVFYHLSQVTFRLNLHGRLTHGEKLPDSPYNTGVWVPTPSYYTRIPDVSPDFSGGLVRIPKSKLFYAVKTNEANNPYGSSSIRSILKYHLFKEAFRDMLAIALDRYGTPLLWAVVPPQDTEEVVQNIDGTTRNLSLHEVVARELENIRSETGIVFTQIDKDHPVKLNALTTGNNFADSFTSAIELCDDNMLRGLSIPNLIMKEDRSGLGTGGSSERQVEIYNMFTSSIFDIVATSLLNGPIIQLIQYNFDSRVVSDAADCGEIVCKPFRYSDIATLGQTLMTLEDKGYLNANNPKDFQYIRSLFALPDRELLKEDLLNNKKKSSTRKTKVSPINKELS